MSKPVGETMRTKLMVVGPSTGIDDAARFMLQHSVSALPVVDERGKVLGLLSKTDIVRYQLGAHPEVGERTVTLSHAGREVQLVFAASSDDTGDQPRVGDVMMPIGFGVEPTAGIDEAAQLMIDGRIHRLLVTEDNHLVGLVSALDLLPRKG
jgi:CBS domain-containing protein